MANNYKKAGFFTVKQVNEYSGIPISTLRSWHNSNFLKASLTVPIGDVDTYYYKTKEGNLEKRTERKKGEVRYYNAADILKLNMIIILQEIGIKDADEIRRIIEEIDDNPEAVYGNLIEKILKKISYLRKLATLTDRMYQIGMKAYALRLSTTRTTIDQLINECPECDLEYEESSDIDENNEEDVAFEGEIADILSDIKNYKGKTDEFREEWIPAFDRLNSWCERKLMNGISPEEINNLPPIALFLWVLGEGDGYYARCIDIQFGEGMRKFLSRNISFYLLRQLEEKLEYTLNEIDDNTNPESEEMQNAISALMEFMSKLGVERLDFQDVFYSYIAQKEMNRDEEGINKGDLFLQGYEIWKQNNGIRK